MGSCVSLSSTAVSASAAAAESAHALTAKVVGLDGSMAQFAAPVTAHEALAATTAAGAATAAPSSSPPRCFLCCSDDLDFDAPVRALGARDALRPGQLYFALPASALGRPLSAQDMAALAVKASAALGTAPVVVVVASGNNKQQRRHSAGRRVAPLVVVSEQEDGGGEWKSDHAGGVSGDAREAAAVSGDRTVGKARRGVVGHKGVIARRLAAAQRLSAIAEAAVE